MFLKTKSKTYDLTQGTLVMGILNVTPDSFSDGGHFNDMERAVNHAVSMEAAGADIIDIGGESTRPDHKQVSIEEEIERVIPMIKVVKEHVQVPISIDTYKSEVAEAAILAGAEIINDIWGAKWDNQIASIAARYDVPIILMHNRDNTTYHSIIPDMVEDLKESIAIAHAAGVRDEQLIVDPGIGFGKERIDNYIVLQKLDELIERLPYPMLLGASRKSFISEVLDIPPAERDNATGATTCLGIQKGARIIRVHDVKRHVELVKMTEAILQGGVQHG